MANDDEPPAYGYAKPPPGRRFQRGVSGNPGGRPKKVSTMGRDAHDALAETVEIKENGVKLKITKQRAAAKQLANASATGNLRAIKLAADLARADAAAAAGAVDSTLTADEDKIAERLIARIRQGWKQV